MEDTELALPEDERPAKHVQMPNVRALSGSAIHSLALGPWCYSRSERVTGWKGIQ